MTAPVVEEVVGLPDPNVARTWGGRLLVDSDGAEIGTCTQIFLDDTTGRPEWATADLGAGAAFIPLMDAVESGEQVQVAVRRDAVTEAPSVGDVQHLSEDEEERLYRHYGIAYSRAESDSGLPAGEAPAGEARVDQAPVDEGPVEEAPPTTWPAPSDASVPATPPAPGIAVRRSSDEAAPDEIQAAAGAAPNEVVSTFDGSRRRRFLALVAGIVAAVGAIAAGLLWSRRRAQRPPTRTEQLAARARSASLVLDARRRQAVASAAPFLQNGKRVSAAAQQAIIQAAPLLQSSRRTSAAAAQRAIIQAAPLLQSSKRVSAAAAQRAAVQAAAAAEQAAALAALARTIRLTRAGGEDQPEPAAVQLPDTETDRPARLAGALKTAVSFGAGYLLGSSAGRSSLRQAKQLTATWAQHPAVQQTNSRLRAQATSTWQTGNARLSQGTASVRGRLARRSTVDDASVGTRPSESDTAPGTAGENGRRGDPADS